MKVIATNPNYWDCECPRDYIHAKATDYCSDCKTHQEDAPDSREDEIASRLKCDLCGSMVIRLTCCPCGCGIAFCDWCSRTYHVEQRRGKDA